jgi:putative DNA primase/helicase
MTVLTLPDNCGSSDQSDVTDIGSTFEPLSNFLAAFFPDPKEEIRLRALPPKGAEGVSRCFSVSRCDLLSIPKLQEQLNEINKEKGLFFVVNSGGDSDAEIHRFNAFFCEADEGTIAEQHRILDSSLVATSMRVETLKSVHAYWLINGDCDAHAWRDIQTRLIHHFNADARIKNPSRLMRLPFFNHVSFDEQSQAYSYKPHGLLSRALIRSSR